MNGKSTSWQTWRLVEVMFIEFQRYKDKFSMTEDNVVIFI